MLQKASYLRRKCNPQKKEIIETIRTVGQCLQMTTENKVQNEILRPKRHGDMKVTIWTFHYSFHSWNLALK